MRRYFYSWLFGISASIIFAGCVNGNEDTTSPHVVGNSVGSERAQLNQADKGVTDISSQDADDKTVSKYKLLPSTGIDLSRPVMSAKPAVVGPRSPSVKWRFNTERWPSAIINESGQVIAWQSNRLIALSPDGDVSWEHEFDSAVDEIVILPDEHVLAFSDEGTMFRISHAGVIVDKTSLPMANRAYMTRGTTSSITSYVHCGERSIYVAYMITSGSSNILSAYSLDMNFLWARAVPSTDWPYLCPLNDGSVLLGVDCASCICYNEFGEEEARFGLDEGEALSFSYLAVSNTGVLLAALDASLYAFNSSGEVVWKYDAATNIQSFIAPLNSGGAIIRTIHGIECIDSGGLQMWEFDTPDLPGRPVVDSDDYVFVGDWTGVLHCLDQDGNEEWDMKVGERAASQCVLGPSGELVVTCGSGEIVYIVDQAEIEPST